MDAKLNPNHLNITAVPQGVPGLITVDGIPWTVTTLQLAGDSELRIDIYDEAHHVRCRKWFDALMNPNRGPEVWREVVVNVGDGLVYSGKPRSLDPLAKVFVIELKVPE